MRNVLSLILILCANVGLGQQVGEWVVVTAKPSAELKRGKDPIARVPRGEVLQIQQVEREWRRVTWQTRKGWLRTADVIPLARAENYFGSVIAREPSAAEYAHRGNARLKLGSLKGAIEDFNESLKLKPDQHSILTLRGSALQAQGRIDLAIKDYTRAIKLDPKYSHALNNRGNSYLAKNDPQKALSDFSKAIELNPANALYRTNRGTAWEAAGDMAKALADHSKAIELDPECDAALLNRARARHVQGDFQNALVNYEAVLGLNPKDDRPYNGIAWLHATAADEKFQDGDKAVEYAQQACELTAWKSANYLDTLAAAYARQGSFDKAVETIGKAIELDDSAEFKTRLKLYRKKKAYTE